MAIDVDIPNKNSEYPDKKVRYFRNKDHPININGIF